MMPNGCTLLDIDGLSVRLCERLGVDCAKAVVGFNYKRGRSYPEYANGLIVPVDCVEALVLACEEQAAKIIEEETKKAKEKTDKLWKRLVRKVIVSNRLDKTF